MKILYLCTYYHRALIFRDLMDRLKEFGQDVKAFNAVVEGSKIDDKYKKIMDSKVAHRECFKKWDRFFYFTKQRKFYKALIQTYDLSEFNLIHSHNLFNGGYAARQAYKEFGIPYVVSIRNTDVNTFLKIPVFKFIANEIVKDAAGIQFLSIPYRDQFISKYVYKNYKNEVLEKSIVVTNGVEDFWLANEFKAKVLSNDLKFNLLCVGKIDKNKNILTILKVIDVLKAKGYSANLTVVGQVVDEDVYKKIKKSKDTTVLNYLKKEELIEVYRKHDIYIMPSIHETFGRVYAEAMTQGLPVIYSKGQGFDGIFKNGEVGYAVPSHDVNYITECVEKIIQDYQAISKRCIEESKRFDWNLIAHQISDFYNSI